MEMPTKAKLLELYTDVSERTADYEECEACSRSEARMAQKDHAERVKEFDRLLTLFERAPRIPPA